MKRLIGVLLSGMVLVGCGGGGGGSNGGSKSTSSAGASSSSVVASSASSPAANACGSAGTLFAECLNSNWGQIKTWEQNILTGEGGEHLTPTNNSNVQWQMVTAAAAGHNQVVQVDYGQKADVWTQFQIMSSTPLNLTSYGTGTLSFDINVLDFGEALDPFEGNIVFDVRIECAWPCTSHTAKVPVSISNAWQHVDISIADMVRSGLDLSKVDSSFLIRPWTSLQKGVSFQLDNIEWKKGTAPLPAASTAVFEEHFNQRESVDAWSYVFYEGAAGQISGSKFLSQGLFLNPAWTSTFDLWALETSLSKPINIKNKQASLQIQMGGVFVVFEYDPQFQLIAKDGNGRLAETPFISSHSLQSNEWSEVSWSFGNVFANGFNAADVRTLGIRFRANGMPADTQAWIQLDTIRVY